MKNRYQSAIDAQTQQTYDPELSMWDEYRYNIGAYYRLGGSYEGVLRAAFFREMDDRRRAQEQTAKRWMLVITIAYAILIAGIINFESGGQV